jgi:hypothetical protein
MSWYLNTKASQKQKNMIESKLQFAMQVKSTVDHTWNARSSIAAWL